MTDAELVRIAINTVKEFALTNEYTNAPDLAQKQFIANPNTHNDWDILDAKMKTLFIEVASAAIYEITTGKEIK
jgi:hypothetical protein